MASYAVSVEASARKELDALDDSIFDRIASKVARLAEDPRPFGCKKLKGRVVYRANDAGRSGEDTRVAHRKDVYDL